MNIKKFDRGMVAANCYILSDENEAVVIDPGVSEKIIMEYLEENQLKLKFIVFTHAHIDHILHSKELKQMTGAKTVIHELDNPLLTDSFKNGAFLFGLNNQYEQADITVKDNDVISFSNVTLTVIHTPGHTPGGMCLYYDNCLFTGDTLFYLSIGRTDLGMGDFHDIIHSIKEKLFTYQDDVVVYPGHGKNTTIGFEKKNNTYI
ncbi:MAG: MBL fold metallo-hydrolase [Clostridia bacterium]|nr:MBL fold metallo-hydrolase [Clostridia bacterium]